MTREARPVVFLYPLNGGPDVALGPGLIVIGRHPACDVRVRSPRVSRRHCCLTARAGDVLVRDLGSTNGTRINGRRVPSGRLRPGDELALADVCYRLVESAGEGPAGEQRGRSPGPKGPTPS
jgi:pSer/pThr/pTyr-binding forkhead associated (FHA) protein